MNEIILRAQAITKSYRDGSNVVDVLKGLDLSIHRGERIAIVGSSGSGKSTLLHLLGGLDTASSGALFIQDRPWNTCSEKKRCQLRNRHLGFIYQFHHLLPEFTAMENVAMPLLLAGCTTEQAKEKALTLLDKVGLSHRSWHKPSQLSGGERQRVAIARALVNQPDCVLADEPTGNLDNATAAAVFEYMMELNTVFQTALVIVTHDRALAERMDRVLTLQDGKLL